MAFQANKKSLQHLSIFDDNSNFTGIAKLGTFIRSILQNFNIFEHILRLVPMKSTATGKNILESIVAMHQLCVVVASFNTHIMTLGHTGTIMKLHSVIHQEALWTRTTKYNEFNCKSCKYGFV